MMTRRMILFAFAALIASSSQLLAQPAKVLPRVAMLFPGSPAQHNELVQAFLQAMRENGYVDGRDFVFDLRYVGTSGDELDRALNELLPIRPTVIVTIGSQGAWAAKKATSTIPIVMATVADPVGQGLVASLARPEGNLTGNAILTEEVIAKRLRAAGARLVVAPESFIVSTKPELKPGELERAGRWALEVVATIDGRSRVLAGN